MEYVLVPAVSTVTADAAQPDPALYTIPGSPTHRSVLAQTESAPIVRRALASWSHLKGPPGVGFSQSIHGSQR